MKKSRLTTEQITDFIKQADAGKPGMQRQPHRRYTLP